MQSRDGNRRENLDVLYENGSTCAVRRNPYLVEFEAQRSQGYAGRRQGRAPGGRRNSAGRRSQGYAGSRQGQPLEDRRNSAGRRSQGYAGSRQGQALEDRRCGADQGSLRQQLTWERPGAGRGYDTGSQMSQVPARRPGGRRNTARRRRMAMMQRALVGVWIFCILVLVATLLIRNSQVSAGQKGTQQGENAGAAAKPQYSGYQVQGLPAEEFAKHPAWTEDFLTVNEYSRPGDPLESVKNIFVHYTANPGTSAAQNKSYFEGLKDSHETSASSHFIIGYEGEIIQCVPLDEIAYAVQSRNGDSVSIECCYLAEDGSFTQETYDSLLSLLRWLLDVYDLDAEDILRHYDCGGKKCPLYYTENPGAWEELKKDVDKL